MSGVDGAVYAVEIKDNCFELATIANKPAQGICGSGVIDLMAKLLMAGFVEPTGAFSDSIPESLLCTVDPPAADGTRASDAVERPAMKAIRIASGANDAAALVFTQKDVREFQLAKGAIRAGVDILIREMGAPPDVLFLAGGFGQNINLDSATAVGLLPESVRGKVHFIGNSSLGGCEDACLKSDLKTGLAAEVKRIIVDATEINLAAHPDFNDTFMETMMF
jgi:uncharacterized 2Fe-2S/4Fe-4S cluster protein (DUF4445 family)